MSKNNIALHVYFGTGIFLCRPLQNNNVKMIKVKVKLRMLVHDGEFHSSLLQHHIVPVI